MNTTESYRIPIKELFNILNIDDIEYDSPVRTNVNVKIKSPSGFVPVEKFVKKQHQTAEYVFSDDSSLKCSTKHVVFENSNPVFISDANKVDTVDGFKEIVGVIDRGEGDVYDVALPSPHQYVTPNGVIHHNTTLAYILVNECDFEDVDVKYIAASI